MNGIGTKHIRKLDAPNVFMVSLAGFIIITKKTFPINYQRQSIFVRVRTFEQRLPKAPYNHLNKRILG